MARLLLCLCVMMPRQAVPSTDPTREPRRSSASRGTSAARERWIPSHDPTLRERLEVAAAHLLIARRAAGAGLATWVLRREVELAGREILLARRILISARRAGSRRDIAQSRMLDHVSRAAAELQQSTLAAARLLDAPIAAHR